VRKILLLVIAFAVLTALTASALPAAATAAAPATTASLATGAAASRSLGDSFVDRLMQAGSCDTIGRHTMFGNGATYLASCTGGNGALRVLVVVPVKRGGLDVDTSYIRARINDVCKGDGGAVFSAGIKDRFAVMYLGKGDDTQADSGAYRAVTLFNGLTEQLATEAGAFRSGSTCAQGRVVRKVV
jgi:hypothetical protein